MTAVEIFFWLSLGVLFYCYAGYGILVFAWNHFRRIFSAQKIVVNFEMPAVTLIVAAYNEEAILERKIKNTLELDYPSHLLRVIFITDGSTDASEEILAQHEAIIVL